MNTPPTGPTRRLALGLLLAALGLIVAGPARAEVHGGIEIGAKGVKATALDVTGGAEGYDVKVLMSGTRNTTLVAGLASASRFEAGALKSTAAEVARFAARMQKEHQVPAARIYVVASSGLFTPLKGDKAALEANQAALAAAVRDACGLRMSFLSVEREVELSLAGIVPAKYAADSLLLDVGSGNTKGGCRDAGGGCVTVSIPYGSVTFAELVRKRAGDRRFADAAAALRAEVLAPALKKGLDDRAGLRRRKRVYLSGGAVWAMASLVRPADRGSYVALTTDDIAAYHKLLRKTPDAHPEIDLSSIADEAVRQAARKEIERVKGVFPPRQLLAGAEILAALASEFPFDREKKLYFARHAPTGWILAYVAEKAGTPR